MTTLGAEGMGAAMLPHAAIINRSKVFFMVLITEAFWLKHVTRESLSVNAAHQSAVENNGVESLCGVE